MVAYRTLQQYAIAISIISVVYNGLEGGVSIGFGADSKSRALIFFGIQSGIEVISALLVVWRFRKVAKPGEERQTVLDTQDLRFEKWGTLGIGFLLIILALGTVASSIAVLALHQEPDKSNASIIISASALVCMILIWLTKRYLAAALNSSTMKGEAICSLSCIQLTCVLFVGSLIFRVWKGGWWLDGATSMVLSILFGWEGYKMLRWAGSKEFTGGCCEHCRIESSAKGEGLKDLESGGDANGVMEKCDCCSDDEKEKEKEDAVGPPNGDISITSETATGIALPEKVTGKCCDGCCSDQMEANEEYPKRSDKEEDKEQSDSNITKADPTKEKEVQNSAAGDEGESGSNCSCCD
ncbi:hypothetical protein CPC08DRAFT_666299 [Agrocybe pediades]|nr:hypothetical protein CPC08DRAFT_666299 [Agrocybe pediades]